MSEPFVYLNGSYLPRSQAAFDVEDRGTMFADGVYEVVRYYFGKPLAIDRHVARLRRSLDAIRLPAPPDAAHLDQISLELIRRNQTPEASVYWQITRGPAPRRHPFPREIKPSVLVIAYPLKPINPTKPVPKLSAILTHDTRWEHCSIKSLMLLPNVLAKNLAIESGADEAILHRGEVVTEGTATNVFIVQRGELWTHPADQWILGGVTRQIVIELANKLGVKVIESTYSVEDLLAADEVILTGSTTHVAAVTKIVGQRFERAQPGPVAVELHKGFVEYVLARCPVT